MINKEFNAILNSRIVWQCCWIAIFGCLFCMLHFANISFTYAASEQKTVIDIEKLRQLKESYFTQHRYSEFVDYLKGLRNNKSLPVVSYLIALTRHEQLRYLEQTQSWEEYFSKGQMYREEFIKESLDAIELSSRTKEPVFLYSRCLIWESYKDSQDEKAQEALLDLLTAVGQYSQSLGADLSAIRYVADRLFIYGERIESQKAYNIYLDKLLSSLDEKRESVLVSLIKQLADHNNDIYNPYFAEDVFKKIKEINPNFILDEQTQYIRAYNLEKIKQYQDAYIQYKELVKNYPRSSYNAAATFKIGAISAYVLQDILAAQDYFMQLNQNFPFNPQVIASLYQLGLISQYQGDTLKAGEYYNIIMEKKDTISYKGDLIREVELRLKEIQEGKQLEFNLKTFMDTYLGADKKILYNPNVDIEVKQFNLIPNQDLRIVSSALSPETGCMPVNIEFLWSGDLGSARPSNDQNSFTTNYASVGSKLIQLVVATPTGILGQDLIFIDVAY